MWSLKFKKFVFQGKVIQYGPISFPGRQNYESVQLVMWSIFHTSVDRISKTHNTAFE